VCDRSEAGRNRSESLVCICISLHMLVMIVIWCIIVCLEAVHRHWRYQCQSQQGWWQGRSNVEIDGQLFVKLCDNSWKYLMVNRQQHWWFIRIMSIQIGTLHTTRNHEPAVRCNLSWWSWRRRKISNGRISISLHVSLSLLEQLSRKNLEGWILWYSLWRIYITSSNMLNAM
jgi:hypothetical protein